jgi:hypothetical protein
MKILEPIDSFEAANSPCAPGAKKQKNRQDKMILPAADSNDPPLCLHVLANTHDETVLIGCFIILSHAS